MSTASTADPSPPGPSRRRSSLAAPTAVATLFTLLAILTSAINQAIAAGLFGVGADYDYYRAASTLPNLCMLVFVSAIPAVFMPVFVDCEIKRSRAEAWAFASRFLTTLLVATGTLTIALMLLAPWLIGGGILTDGPAFAPGGPGFDPTTLMLRMQLPNIVFAGLAGVLNALYLAQRSFARPSAAPVIQTGVMLLTLVLGYRVLGIVALALGSVLGPLVQVLFLLPVLRGGYRPMLGARDPDVLRLTLRLAPVLAAALVSKGADLVETRVASGMAVGSLTIIGLAGVIVDRTANLVTQGVTLTSFPDLARRAAGGETRAFRERFSLAVRFTLLPTIPAAVGLVVLRERLVALLFERGQFTPADTAAVGLVVVGLLGVLLAAGFGRIVTNGLYAHQRTHAVAWIGIGGMGVYLGLAHVLPARFDSPVMGLAVAWSAVNLLNVAVAAWMLRRYRGPLDGARIARSAARMAVAAFVMGAAVYLGDRVVARWILALGDPLRTIVLAGELVTLGAGGMALYLAVLGRLGGTEGAGLAAVLRRFAAALVARLARLRRATRDENADGTVAEPAERTGPAGDGFENPRDGAPVKHVDAATSSPEGRRE